MSTFGYSLKAERSTQEQSFLPRSHAADNKFANTLAVLSGEQTLI